MKTYVFSTVDLYGGDVKAGKLYPLTTDDEYGFHFTDDGGLPIYGSWSVPSAHHADSGGEWVKVTDYDAHEGEGAEQIAHIMEYSEARMSEYTTDELIHAVRAMRAEVRRRTQGVCL